MKERIEKLAAQAHWQHGDNLPHIQLAITTAVNEALELAARECDTEKEKHVMSKYAREGDCLNARQVARSCAATIRKLKVE